MAKQRRFAFEAEVKRAVVGYELIFFLNRAENNFSTLNQPQNPSAQLDHFISSSVKLQTEPGKLL